MLREIEADPPFDSVEELIALVHAVGETHVHIKVSNAPADLAERLVEHGHGSASLKATATGPYVAPSVAEFARTHVASYIHATHSGVSLRVWPEQTQVDGLSTKPLDPLTTSYIKPASDDTRFSAKRLTLERGLELWLPSAGGPVTVTALGILRPGLVHLFGTLGTDAVPVDARLSCVDALALARAHPDFPMSWAAGNLHMEVPEFTARRFPVATKSQEEIEATKALFRSARAKSKRT